MEKAILNLLKHSSQALDTSQICKLLGLSSDYEHEVFDSILILVRGNLVQRGILGGRQGYILTPIGRTTSRYGQEAARSNNNTRQESVKPYIKLFYAHEIEENVKKYKPVLGWTYNDGLYIVLDGFKYRVPDNYVLVEDYPSFMGTYIYDSKYYDPDKAVEESGIHIQNAKDYSNFGLGYIKGEALGEFVKLLYTNIDQFNLAITSVTDEELVNKQLFKIDQFYAIYLAYQSNEKYRFCIFLMSSGKWLNLNVSASLRHELTNDLHLEIIYWLLQISEIG